MRPVPIEAEIAELMPGQRAVIGPPLRHNFLETSLPPVEAMVETVGHSRAYSMRCVLEDGDLEKLAAGGAVWITILGQQLSPFAVTVGP